MNNKLKLFFAGCTLLAFGCSCNTKPKEAAIALSPEAGSSYKSGDVVNIKVSYPADTKADSVVYLLDSVRLAVKKDSSALTLKTDSMHLGVKLITAKVYTAGKSEDITTNIVLYAAKAPEEYTFKIEKTFPHDTGSYTEGLIYQDGIMYESGGGYLDPPPGQPKDGQSSLKKYDLTTGKTIKKVMVDPKKFAEGIAIVGDKLIQLTWKEKVGYVYDKNTLALLSSFNDTVGQEGWGMTFDGKFIYADDSTNRIWIRNKDNYSKVSYIDVYDDKGPINSLNELEYIDGKIYANVWQTNNIVVIDPRTGVVLQRIDMSDLYPATKRNPNADVLNGIAYDKTGNRIFVTGKKWDKMFQVKFVKK
jgi:glutamine cyclotransferase